MDRSFLLLFTFTSFLLCVNCYPSPGVKSLVAAFGEVDDEPSQVEAAKIVEAIILRNLLSILRPDVVNRITSGNLRSEKRSGKFLTCFTWLN